MSAKNARAKRRFAIDRDYDALGRKSETINPNGYTTTYAYDAVGHLVSTTDPDARVVTFAFDAAGHETGSTWHDADSNVVNVQTFTYDAAGHPLTASDDNGTYTFTYDALGRVASESDVWGLIQTFTYDAIGERTLVQDSLGGTTTSVYDADGHLTSRKFTDGTTPLRVDETYNADGQVASMTRYSDLAGSTVVARTTYTYNAVGAVTNIVSEDGSSTGISNLTYTYRSFAATKGGMENGVCSLDNVCDQTSMIPERTPCLPFQPIIRSLSSIRIKSSACFLVSIA